MHSRGNHIEQDNLIAIEMKKSNASEEEKQKDKDRLKALTKDSFDDVWSFDGTTLPEHVCRYLIGIYYEINFSLPVLYSLQKKTIMCSSTHYCLLKFKK